MEKSETASRGGRIISNKIKLENLMRIVRLVAAIFQIAIIVIAFMSKQVIVLNITDLKGYTPDYIQWYFYEYTGVQNESGLIQLVEVIKVVSTVLLTTEIAIIGSFRYSMGEMSGKEIFAFSAIHLSIYALSYIMLCALFKHYYLYWDLLLPEILIIMVWEMSSRKRKRGFLK